jgi:hypothetical protein
MSRINQFPREWKEYRQKIMQGLFENEIDRMAAQIPEHHHPKHNPALDRVEALQQLRIQAPGHRQAGRVDQATSCANLSALRDPEDRDPGEPDDDERDPADARSSSIRTLHLSEYDMGAP